MNILIVEDETMARKKLAAILEGLYPDMKIVGETDSVSGTISWLNDRSHKADIIFMDVELADGNCFEIFRQTDINASVIMTTAYDNYAVKAFEVESTDYLLKPVGPESVKRAVERCLARMGHGPEESGKAAENAGRGQEKSADESRTEAGHRNIRKRFLVRLNDTIVPVLVADIAYFYSEDKSTYLITRSGKKYVVDFSLDIAMEQLDHEAFFRISRNCITAMSAISRIVKMGSRYMIESIPAASFEMMVSRSRTDDFLHWLEER